MYRNKVFFIVVIFTSIFVLYRSATISMFEDSKRRNFMRGDAYSDINLYSAVHHFNDSGLLNTKALPVHYYKVPLKDTVFKPTVYTHYPALPDILAYFYSKISNTQSEFVLRIFMLIISLVFSFLFYHFFILLFNDEKIAITAWLMMMFSNFYLGWADSLHKHVYEEFFKITYLILLIKYLKNHNWKYLIAMFIVMVLVSNISFEPIVFLGVISLCFSLHYKMGLFSKLTLIAGVGAIIGVCLHLWQNIEYFGSLDLAIKDLSETAKLRTAGIDVESKYKKLESPFGLLQVLELPFLWLNRMERFYLLPAWGVIAMWFYVRKEFNEKYKTNEKKWFLFLFISSFSWCIVMSQHAYVHSFTTRQSAILYFAVAAPVLVLFFHKMKSNFNQEKLITKVILTLIVMYNLSIFLSQQVYDLWYINTFQSGN